MGHVRLQNRVVSALNARSLQVGIAVFTLLGGVLLARDSGAGPRVLHVAPSGAAYKTIQSAVDAAQPGDSVLVAGGVYRESVSFPRSGLAGQPITVRGKPNRIVLVTPSAELSGTPREVPEHPNVYRWEGFDRAPFGKGSKADFRKTGIWEAPTHLRLKRVYSLGECERRLASWFYDTRKQELYVRSSGAAPAKELTYVVEDARHPVFEIRQSHIVLDGLQMAFGAHGVLIAGKANHVTVRYCRAFCNRSAGIHMSGNHHALQDNELFRNNHYGIQLRYGVSYSRIAGNLAYYNGPNNGETTGTSLPTDLGTYSRGGYNIFENNIIDGLHQYAFRNKYGANNTIVFRNNVVRGFFYCQSPCIRNNTVIVNSVGVRFGQYINRVDPSEHGDIGAVDPAGVQRRTSIIYPAVDRKDPRFADPAHRDFRLQGDSPYRGRGAFPEETPVMFVDPSEGSDGNSGRSVTDAFKSFAKAMGTVHPGDTIYLLPGAYEKPFEISVGGLTEEEPLRIRAWGKSPKVVLRGGVTFKARKSWSLPDVPLAHVSLEGLTILDKPVEIAACTDVRLSHCVLAGQETALDLARCSGVRLDHVTLRGVKTGVHAANCRDVSVTNSLFVDAATGIACDAASQPELYADHNTYTALRNRLSKRVVKDLADWQETVAGGYSSRVAAVNLDEEDALPMGSSLAFAASDFTFAGARPAPAAKRLEIRHLRAAGLAPTAASLLWQTPRGVTEAHVELRRVGNEKARVSEPVSTFQIVGEYFDMTFRLSGFYTADRHVTLDGLRPNTEYEARVTARKVEGTAGHTEALRFRTPAAAPTPATWYVSTRGDDNADGKRPESAWRSFARAVRGVGPGDRVVVLPGVYSETLRPRVSGTKAQPIVFESAEPQAAVIDLMQSLAAGIEIANVNYVHFKGFALANGAFTAGENFRVANAKGIRISSCHVRYPAKSSFDKLRLGHGGLIATNAPDLMVDNNVFLCGFVGVGLGSCPNAKVLHNTILGEGNYGVTIVPSSEEETYTVRNNLFYRPVMGYKTGAAFSMYNLRPRIDADYNLYYIPEKYKGTIGMMTDGVRHRTIEEWREASGYDAHSVVAMPVFVDPEHGDFRLRPGSPGSAAAEDGGAVGFRTDSE